jgi:glucosamine-6-phosphate deaminase
VTVQVRVVAAPNFGRDCLHALLESMEGTERPVVGLPTGRTPVPLFEELRRSVEAGQADVRNWRPFAIDEYGGPRAHPCSNRAFFNRYWDSIPGAPAVQQFDPDATDREAEANRIASILETAGGLDAALLGIGTNGHLAFNEPGSAYDSVTRWTELREASRTAARDCWGEQTPTWGLTLGLRELLSARSLVVLANGAHKAAILQRALEGPMSSECPASFVREVVSAIWVLDDAAAGALSGRS